METLLPVLLLVAYAVMVALDFVVPARSYPALRFWRLKGFAFFVLNVGLFTTLPFLWDGFLGEHRLIDATGLGTWGGALVGLLVQQLLSYTWHRSMHRTPLLWRFFHQLHHSAERVDIFGAMYFSPLDVLGFALVGSLGLVWVVGLTPEAALIANTLVTFASLFQHSNLKTPRWLGYVIQRPESHAVHHSRGVHAFNYGDFAIWDLVFGTSDNPARCDAQAGFYDGASRRIGAMLLGRDVSAAELASPPCPRTARTRPSLELRRVGAAHPVQTRVRCAWLRLPALSCQRQRGAYAPRPRRSPCSRQP
jgi:sterol desaturase/sphingolipid hydroxylase (fatty acid hydroxylase superfamily)